VALCNGSTLAVGGQHDNSGIGAIWIWTWSGTSWIQNGSKLVGTGGSFPGHGTSVALSLDGNTLAEGGENDNGGPGAAWVFTWLGGTWTQFGSKLNIATGSTYFGASVDLSSDGTTLAIGSLGKAWIYDRT
jgi:hypothetical protein